MFTLNSRYPQFVPNINSANPLPQEQLKIEKEGGIYPYNENYGNMTKSLPMLATVSNGKYYKT